MGQIKDKVSLQATEEQNTMYWFPVPGEDSSSMEKHKDYPCVDHQN